MLAQVVDKAENRVSEIIESSDFEALKIITKGTACKDTLYFCDNLLAMGHLIKNDGEGLIDLVYIDPPFNTSSSYKKKMKLKGSSKSLEIIKNAYNDSWTNLSEYLEMMTTRLILIHKLLSEKGTLYLHVDTRTVHYFRLILDHIFGEGRFLNEIIWSYKSGGTGRKSYSKKHDNILVYTKTEKYIFHPQKEKSYNRGLAPYRFKGVEEFKDDIGWHTLVNLKDVWSIDMVGRTSSERVGYETQKPLKLIERILQVSSDESSIVADFFMGSGTAAVAAKKLGRRFLGSDDSMTSYVTVLKRIAEDISGFNVYRTGLEHIAARGSLEADVDLSGLDLKISIIAYKPDDNVLAENKIDQASARKLIEENPRIFIDYIGIFGVKNNQTFAEGYFGTDIPAEITIKECSRNCSSIILELVDVFGAHTELDLGGDNIG
jgi:adenine specific DNA methylase Mod